MTTLLERVKHFARLDMSTNTSMPDSGKVAAVKTIQNEYLAQWLRLSDFMNMDECQIYEQLLVWEPEIGGSIDRISTMVGESIKGFTIKDMDKMDELRQSMLKDADEIAETTNIRNTAEVLSEILYTYGNLFIEPKEDLSLSILPNRYITIVDDEERILAAIRGEFPENIIMEANKLVLYEGRYGQRIINKDKFIQIKYKDTPIFWNDSRGRQTFGIYAASPLHKVIMPIWEKRMINMLDIMWRYKNVPREHHQISSEMFSLDKYVGDNNTKRTTANAEALAFVKAYSEGLKAQVSDQGYTTLDTVTIGMVESKNTYMQTNELLEQIRSEVWTAMNMPKSMITGESDSSYASELVIANYVEQKITQLANKIKPILLDNMRKRLLVINSSYPVNELTMTIGLDIAATELETVRVMAIMDQTGRFTDDEIRGQFNYKPLTDDQRKEIEERAKKQMEMKQSNMNSGRIDGSNKPSTPQTPQSSSNHANDQSTKNIRTDK